MEILNGFPALLQIDIKLIGNRITTEIISTRGSAGEPPSTEHYHFISTELTLLSAGRGRR
jgi:hypothetical protein